MRAPEKMRRLVLPSHRTQPLCRLPQRHSVAANLLLLLLGLRRRRRAFSGEQLRHGFGLVLTRRARNALGTATQCTRRNDSPSPLVSKDW